MATEQLTRVLRHVRQLIGLGRDDLTDSDLLERFVGRLDESAFEELVRRHGPMVQRTCRRVLGDVHAAEDAFQAVFLVLARKAGSIRQRRSIAGWLYEVAYNLALRARADAARRRLHERRASEMPKPLNALTNDPEMQAVLDEELHRLPEKYRTPLVLCYIEGKTNEEAARELGWPSGSMSYRLAQARELLRKRLSSRGLALPAGALLVLLTESAAPAVSATLVKMTVQAATSFAAGKTIAAGTVSAEAVALAEGALHTMLTTKMKIAAGLLLAVSLLGSGARMFVHADSSAASPTLAAADASPKLPTAETPAGVDVSGDPLPAGAVARLGTLRWRHNSPIMLVAYSTDGKQIITATQDGGLRVLEANGGKEIRKFGKAAAAGAGPLEPIAPRAAAAMMLPARATLSGVALSADTKTLAVSSHDGTITLWDVDTGKELRNFKSNPVVAFNGLTFAPDGKSIFGRALDGSLRQFDVAEGKELKKLTAAAQPQPQPGAGAGGAAIFIQPFTAFGNVGVTPDNKNVLAIGQEFKNNQTTALIRSWELATGKDQTVQGPQMQGGFHTVTFSSDAKLVAFAHYTGTVYVWDIAARKEVAKLVGPQNNYSTAMSFAPDSKTLAVRTSADGLIHIWSVAESKEIQKLGDAPPVNANGVTTFRGSTTSNLAFSADGSQLATGTEANTVRQFDTKTGKEIAASSGGHHGAVMSVALSPDGKTAITREPDGTTHLWAADSGKETKRYSLPANVFHAAFSADGKMMALGTVDGNVLLWDALEGKELKSWKASAQPNQGFAALALSSDGKTVATRSYDQIIHLWDTTGRELRQVADSGEANNGVVGGFGLVRVNGGYNASTQGLVFSPDGTLLAGMAIDRVDNPNGNIKRPIAAASPTTLRLWDVSTGKQVRKFETPANTNIAAFAFAPDGRTLASANFDGSISLWEAASGKERQRITFKGLAQAAPLPAAKEEDVKAVAKAVMIRPVGGIGSQSCIAFSPDGKVLAVAGQEAVIRFWDMVASKERNTLKGHQSNITTLAFALNGKRIATGSADTTALVWDVPAEEKAPAVQLEAKQAEQLVEDLSSDDAAKAYQAIRTLSQVPAQVVPLLKTRLQAVAPPDTAKVAQLITDLDSNTFVTRKKAEDELDKLGELAEDAIRKALSEKPNLEMQKRLEALLFKLVTGASPNAQLLRTLRGLEVLESAGTPEAREILKTVAKGAPGARVTKDAQNSLNRLGDR